MVSGYLSGVGLIIIIGHLTPKDSKALQPYLSDRVILTEISQNPETESSRREISEHRIWSVPNGNSNLFMVSNKPREGAPFEFTFRRLALGRLPGPIPSEAEQLRERLEEKQNQSLRVITTKECAHSGPFFWKPDTVARMVAHLTRSDLTLIQLPPLPGFSERFVSPDVVMNSIPQELFSEFWFRGIDLERYLQAVFRSHPPETIGAAGGKLAFLGGKVRAFKMGLESMDLPAIYRVSLNESLYRFAPLRPERFGGRATGLQGVTLWEACINALPEFPPKERLFQ